MNGAHNLQVVSLDGRESHPFGITPGANVSNAHFLQTYTDTWNGSVYARLFTDSHFTATATVGSALGGNATIAQVVFGHTWRGIPNCSITPTATAANAFAAIGYTWYSGSFYLTTLSSGLPIGVYAWDVSCTDR